MRTEVADAYRNWCAPSVYSELCIKHRIDLIEHCQERDWFWIPPTCHVGCLIIDLWTMAKPIRVLCRDSEDKLVNALTHQCDVWYFG